MQIYTWKCKWGSKADADADVPRDKPDPKARVPDEGRGALLFYISSHHPHSSCSDPLLQSIKQALIWSYHPAKNFHFNWQGAPFIIAGVSMFSLTAGERYSSDAAHRTKIRLSRFTAGLQRTDTRLQPAVAIHKSTLTCVRSKSCRLCGYFWH